MFQTLDANAFPARAVEHVKTADTRIAGGNILGALMEAFAAPDRYRLIEANGELFIEAN